MSEMARALVAVLGLVLAFGAGWWCRGSFDGLDVGVAESQSQSQSFVDAGAQAAVVITDAEQEADQARATAQERIRYVEVVKGCPPGRGAVSVDMYDRLSVAFSEGGGEADSGKGARRVRTSGDGTN